jgi:type I restriction-modification system DNA methylase subunit
MENILGRQLWSIYEGLKRDNKIGFLTDYEFQKYYLGFISYKYLSLKLEVYANNELKGDISVLKRPISMMIIKNP